MGWVGIGGLAGRGRAAASVWASGSGGAMASYCSWEDDPLETFSGECFWEVIKAYANILGGVDLL